jgi:hypothetical protein
MNLTPQTSTEISLNITRTRNIIRTRVTVVMFNLTIIAFKISLLRSRSTAANGPQVGDGAGVIGLVKRGGVFPS